MAFAPQIVIVVARISELSVYNKARQKEAVACVPKSTLSFFLLVKWGEKNVHKVCWLLLAGGAVKTIDVMCPPLDGPREETLFTSGTGGTPGYRLRPEPVQPRLRCLLRHRCSPLQCR